jgi:hypothetical protein
MTASLVYLVALFLLKSAALVEALPTGAAFCPSGEAAVNGPHLGADRIKTGTLAAGNITLVVLGEDVSPSDNNLNLLIGQEYTIGVRSDGRKFRGVLLRAEDRTRRPVGTLVLEPRENDSLLKDATACAPEAPAVGITHAGSGQKTSVSGLIRYDVDADASAQDVTGATLDVTVVIELRNGRSEYYYTPFVLNFLTSLPTPTDSSAATPAPTPASTVREPTRPPVPPTRPPVPATSPTRPPVAATNPPVPTTPPPFPTELPDAADQCLYRPCDSEADCCAVAPICRLRTVGGVSQTICSSQPRLQKTKLCENCGGSGARPKERM